MIARYAWSYAVVLLCTLLVLGGCAAGSPSVVVPEAPQDTLPAIEGAQPADVAAMAPVAPTAATATALPESDVAQSVTNPPSTAPNDNNPEVFADGSTATGTASFAQDVALTPEPPVDPNEVDAVTVDPNTVDPNASTTDTALEAAPDEPADVTIAEPVDSASVASGTRPPPPPDPGTGMSTIVEGGANGRMEVALTFDAGADRGYGAEILDLLRDQGIKATFGMTGLYAQQNPDLVQRMVAEGHQIINHTWDHPSLTGANTGMPPLTPEQVSAQLWDTENVVSEITGGYQMIPYFRPPYGDYDAASLGYLYDNGFTLSIWWTCDSHGWAGWGAQEIIDYCTTNLVEDEIILLHVGAAAVGDFEALPGMIQSFRDKGYAFVTVEQMLQP